MTDSELHTALHVVIVAALIALIKWLRDHNGK